MDVAAAPTDSATVRLALPAGGEWVRSIAVHPKDPNVLLLGTGCAEDPANVEGVYTVAVTNRENGCGFQNWVEGDSSTGIEVTVTNSIGQTVSSTGSITTPIP